MTEHYLLEGDRIGDHLKVAESKLYRLNVQPDPRIHSITISLNIGTQNSSMVRMFIAKSKDGSLLPTSENSIPVLQTWQGLSARAYEGDESSFCTGCIYKVLVTTTENTSYTLSYITSKAIMNVKEKHFEIYDILRAKEKNCYKVSIKKPEERLNIYLSPYSGDPNIYANPVSIPDNIEKSAYKSKGELGELLSITGAERSKRGYPIGKFIVCIHGETESSYHLMINVGSEKEGNKIEVSCGLTFTMGVDSGELAVFEYPLEKNDNNSITFTLTSITGNADLYVKMCKQLINGYMENPCTLTKDELNSDNVKKSTETNSIDIIQSLPTEHKCNERNIKCSYLIGVLGVEESHFSLGARCTTENEIMLTEGMPHLGWVGINQEANFVFYVTNPDVSQVKVQLTSLSGDADLKVFRLDPNLEGTQKEKSSGNPSHIPDTVIFSNLTDGKLNTAYHIRVNGVTFSLFTLVYSLTLPTAQAITLLDGRPQQDSFNGTENYALYRFFTNSTMHDIRIFLTSRMGSFNAYIGVNYIPTTKNFTWCLHPYDSNLLIEKKDPANRPKGIYYILVTKSNIDDLSLHLYSIKYVTGTHSTTVTEGFPEVGSLQANEIAYYIYYVNEVERNIIVTVTPFTGDPDLYISVNSSNPLPSQTKYDYFSAGAGGDTIELNPQKDFKKNILCGFFNFTNPECAIFIAVKCSNEECSYDLQVSRSGVVAQRLIDGLPQFGTVADQKPQFYVFTPNSTKNPTFISIYPKAGRVKAYVNLSPWSLLSFTENKKLFPTPENNTIKSVDRASTEVLVIPKSLAEKCGFLCEYYIGVYYEPDLIESDKKDSDFTIAATSNFLTLVDGNTVVDYVNSGMYRYYKFRVTCKDCSLTISLTPLSSGDPDLFVNKELYLLPTSQYSHFKSTGIGGEFMQITNKDPYLEKYNQTVKGDYIIGVYGAENCTYSLIVTTTSSIINTLYQGVPVRQEMHLGEIRYFSFQAWKEADIKLSLALHSGRATIRANIVKSKKVEDLLANLPKTEKDCRWSSETSNSLNSLTISKSDKAFNSSGYYIFAVEAIDEISFDVVVETISDMDYSILKSGEPHRGHIKAQEKLQFAFIVSSFESISIAFNSLYGNVEGKIYLDPKGSPLWHLQENVGIQISSADINFKLGTYYIILRGIEESEFIITVEQRVRMISLTEGLPHSSSTNSTIIHYYLYHVPAHNALWKTDHHFNIYVKFYHPVDDAIIYVRHITRQNSTPPNAFNSEYTIRYDPELAQLGDSLTFNNEEPIAMAIALQVNTTQEFPRVKYDIVAWTSGIVLIVPDHQYVNSFSKPHELHVYELNLEHPSIVYVEIEPCIGEVEFFVTETQASINDRKYDLKKIQLNKGRLFGHFNAVKKTYYISVHAVALGKNNEISYTIKSFLSNEADISEAEDFSLEHNGNLEYSLSGAELQIKWGKVYKRTIGKKEEIKAQFSLYIAEEGIGNMLTPCGIKHSKAEQIVSGLTENSFTYLLKSDLVGKGLVFNVIATVKTHSQSLTYNPLLLQVPKITASYLWLYICNN